MIKRIIIIYMAFLILPLKSIGATKVQIDDLYYNLYEGTKTAEVTYLSSSSSSNKNYVKGTLEIPSKITYENDEYSVTSIGTSAFIGCSELTEIKIPSSVLSIGSKAFYDCTGINSLTIEDGEDPLKLSSDSSSSGQFGSCPLEKVYIGRDLTYSSGSSYGYSPMAKQTKLTNVTWGPKVSMISDYLFYGCTAIQNIAIPNSVTSIGNYAFSGCTSLTSISIPNSVISISSYAFNNCQSLGSIIIPSSVSSIGNNSFNGCSGITSITFEDGEEALSLGNKSSSLGLFNDCPLEKVYIGRDLTYSSGSSYGYSPIAKQTKLTDVKWGSKVSMISDYLFYGCTAIQNFTIPSSVTSIGIVSFNGCSGITSIIFEDGEETLSLGTNSSTGALFKDCPLEKLYIGRNLSYTGTSSSAPFANKSALTEATIGDKVISIPAYLFYQCKALRSVTVPPTIISIEKYAFYYCNALTDFLIPDAVTSIGESAFTYCENITGTLTLPSSLQTIGSSAFYGLSGLTGTLVIPGTVTQIGGNAFNKCNGINEIRFEDGEEILRMGYNYSEDVGIFSYFTLEKVYIGRSLSNTWTSNDSDHKKGIFANQKELKVATFGQNVSSMPDNLFYGCSGLSSVSLPSIAISLGDYVFYGCSSLTSLSINNSINSMGSSTFTESGLASVTIGEAVSTLGSSSFPPSLRIVTSHSSTPPTATAATFDGSTTQNGVLLVPETSTTAYRYAPYWCDFLKIETMPASGTGGSDEGNNETIFNTQIDNYIYMAVDESRSFSDLIPEGKTASSWKSSDDDIVEITKRGKAEAYEYGNVIVMALDSDGNTLITIGVFVCPTVSVKYSSGISSYQHPVIYNSTPSIYIAAPTNYEIVGISYDGDDITSEVLENEGYYTPYQPITENTIINVNLKSTLDPADLNGDGVVDVADLNVLLDSLLNQK